MTTEKDKTLQEVIEDMDQAEKAISEKASSEKGQTRPTKIDVVDSTENAQVPVKMKVGSDEKKEQPWIKLGDSYDDIVEQTYKFIKSTGSVVILNQGRLDEKTYALAPVWDYIATICGYYVRIESTWAEDNPTNSKEQVIHCRASLMNMENPSEPVTAVESVVETDEEFLKGKPLNVAYGWVQTRAKCRAVQSVLGFLMARVKIQTTPAEEVIQF